MPVTQRVSNKMICQAVDMIDQRTLNDTCANIEGYSHNHKIDTKQEKLNPWIHSIILNLNLLWTCSKFWNMCAIVKPDYVPYSTIHKGLVKTTHGGLVHTLRPQQNGQNFAESILQSTSLNEKF